MGKTMSVVMGVVSIAIVFIVFPILLEGAHTIQTDQVVETRTDVITTAGTTATVTLSQALFKTRAADVVSISSSEIETPTVTTVSNATVIVVGGLNTSATRELSIAYEVDALTDYTGLSAIVGVSPMLVFIGVLGIVVAGAWFAWKSGG